MGLSDARIARAAQSYKRVMIHTKWATHDNQAASGLVLYTVCNLASWEGFCDPLGDVSPVKDVDWEMKR